MAGALAKKARIAQVRGQVTRAVVLLQAAGEISGDVKLLLDLAKMYRMAGQFAEATETYEKLLRLNPPPALAAELRATIAQMKSAPAPYSDELFTRVRATASQSSPSAACAPYQSMGSTPALCDSSSGSGSETASPSLSWKSIDLVIENRP